MASFNQKVYELVKKIPKGKVSTYAIVAKKLNCKAYRAVGNALNKNKNPNKIPCFKIIKSNGSVGGYSKGIKEKIKRLRKERIKIKNGKVENCKEKLFKF